jgi:hypothetical protein
MNDKIDVFQSVKSKAINDITPDLLEIGLDSLTKSEVLKDIPILGLAFKGFSLYQNVTEAFFIKKIIKFLSELKDIPISERERFISELEANKETHKAGEKLLVTLNRLNDLEKAEIIGRLFKRTILGEIEYGFFSKLTHIIDNAYIDDIKLLKNNRGHVNKDVKSSLHQVGLFNQSISDLKRQNDFLKRSFSSREAQPRLEYELNEYCKVLIKYGFE